MIKAIKFPLKESFILHSILNYVDKAVSLISPIVILKFLHDDILYNKIEYILSGSIILSVFLDGGLSSYYFYGYRNSTNKESYIKKIEENYLTLFSIETIISLLVLIVSLIFYSQKIAIYSCLFVRSIFLSFNTFKFNTYRVKNAPSKIFIITISVNLATLAIFLILYHFNKEQEVFYFTGYFLFQFLFIFLQKRSISKLLEFKELFKILKISFLFSWPLIINSFVINIIINYGKVYTYDHLSTEYMTNLSVLQRFMVIIQLAHTSSISFFLKKIFDAEVPTLDLSILKKYTGMMFGSALLVTIAIIVNNVLHLIKPIAFDTTFFVLIIFYILYCYSAFLSTYFTLFNQNKTRLISSVSIVLIYVGALWIIKPATLLSIALIMLFVITLNLIYAIFFLYKKEVIKFKI